MKKTKKTSFLFLLFLLFFGIIISVFLFYKRLTHPFPIVTTVNVKKGDTFSIFSKKLTYSQKIKTKIWAKRKKIDLTKIKVGLYSFSGFYTPKTFFETIAKGPQASYIPITILEGWSIYDIDEVLRNAGSIKTGAYIAYVTNQATIKEVTKIFPFLKDLTKKGLTTLEGVLYPDTYFIDTNKEFVPQLVHQQLKTFYTRVWKPYKDTFFTFTNKLKEHNINLALSPYDIITLASIIEKEEKNSDNQPIIAGIFLKRLSIGMRLDADISLCYGLKESYKTCQNHINLYNLKDTKNPYNTRAIGGLPPTPIANPSERTIDALLQFEANDYIYYLHDTAGQIHYAKTIEEHNLNKKTYLE